MFPRRPPQRQGCDTAVWCSQDRSDKWVCLKIGYHKCHKIPFIIISEARWPFGGYTVIPFFKRAQSSCQSLLLIHMEGPSTSRAIAARLRTFTLTIRLSIGTSAGLCRGPFGKCHWTCPPIPYSTTGVDRKVTLTGQSLTDQKHDQWKEHYDSRSVTS